MDTKRIEDLKEKFSEEAVTAHVAAVEAAQAKYGKIVEVLTEQGSVICRAPVGDREMAYDKYIDGMVAVGLEKAAPSTVNRKFVEACRVVPGTAKELEAIFKERPALVGELVQKLTKLAGGDYSASIQGN